MWAPPPTGEDLAKRKTVSALRFEGRENDERFFGRPWSSTVAVVVPAPVDAVGTRVLTFRRVPDLFREDTRAPERLPDVFARAAGAWLAGTANMSSPSSDCVS